MRFPAPLVPARLLRRYKRFLADVRLADGTETTVHCPNPGRMQGLAEPGLRVWLSRSASGTRRLPLTLELVEADGTLVGINTMHPNRIAQEAIAAGRVPALAGYARIRREVRYGERSRIDLLLEDDGRPPCHVEVKNVHLRRGDQAQFPDAVTARGARHLGELAALVAAGGRAMLLYVVQRADCSAFAVARDIDPAYAIAFERALAAGVESCCFRCRVHLSEITLESPLPMVI
jgi:sugar fermentation stimulation protein A